MSFLGSITNILTGGQGASGKANAGVNAAASDWLKSLYDKTGTQEQPFIESGQKSNKTLMDILLGGDTSAMDPFFNSSVYQFPLQQGLQQIGNNQAAKGLSNSTSALRNAGQFTEGLASQNFQQFIQNLMGLSNAGQQGIATQVGAGTGVAPALGQVAGNQGQAAGQSASAPWAALAQAPGAISSIASLFS